MKTLNTLKTELLNNPQIKAEYDALAPQFAIASQIIEMRQKKGLTQAELALRVGTKQAAIARIESGSYNPSIKSLEKVAQALGTTLKLKLG